MWVICVNISFERNITISTINNSSNSNSFNNQRNYVFCFSSSLHDLMSREDFCLNAPYLSLSRVELPLIQLSISQGDDNTGGPWGTHNFQILWNNVLLHMLANAIILFHGAYHTSLDVSVHWPAIAKRVLVKLVKPVKLTEKRTSKAYGFRQYIDQNMSVLLCYIKCRTLFDWILVCAIIGCQHEPFFHLARWICYSLGCQWFLF